MAAGNGLVTLLLMVVGGFAGRFLAKFKGRAGDATAWTILCALIPIAFPILCFARPGFEKRPERRGGAIAVLAIANLVILVPVLLAAWSYYYFGGMGGLPSCGSPAAVETLQSAVEGSPIGRTLGLRIINVSDVKETSRTDSDRKCSARAMMNNGSDRTLAYRVFNRQGSDNFFVTTDLLQ